MADMTVSGWDQATACKVVRRARLWPGGAEYVVKLNFLVNSWAAGRYPSNGIPLPKASQVGLTRIDYVIPICPLIDNRSSVTTFVRHGFQWGAHLPCGGVSGVTSARGPITMRVIAGIPKPSGSNATDFSGTNPSLGARSHFRESITDHLASQYGATAVAAYLYTYAVFGEL